MDAAERRGIIERARHRCEYCRLGELHQPAVPFHIEHIIARQHGGDDSIEDLALACHPCNLQKGPNLASLDPETGELIRLFHPRRDHWSDHFLVDEGRIVGRTPIGRATAALLLMNAPQRVRLRLLLIAIGLWEE